MNTTTQPLDLSHAWPARRVLVAVVVFALLAMACAALVATWDNDDAPTKARTTETPAAVSVHDDPLVSRFGQPAPDPHEYPRAGLESPTKVLIDDDPLVIRFGRG